MIAKKKGNGPKRRIRARPAEIHRPAWAWLGRSGKSLSDSDRTAQLHLPRGRACAGEKSGRQLGFAGGRAHRGLAGRSQRVTGVAISDGGDGEAVCARMRAGRRRAGGLSRGGPG
jgi:hypothetical protein